MFSYRHFLFFALTLSSFPLLAKDQRVCHQAPVVISERNPCYRQSPSYYCNGRYAYPAGYRPSQRVHYVVQEPVYYYPVYREREVIIIEKEKTPSPFSFFQLFISVIK